MISAAELSKFDTIDASDLKLKCPFTLVVSGATSCGKSHLVAQILTQPEVCLDTIPQEIVYLHGVYQELYDELSSKLSNINGKSILKFNIYLAHVIEQPIFEFRIFCLFTFLLIFLWHV